MIADPYMESMDLKKWVFNVSPAYYYLPCFSGFMLIKPFKGTDECELLFYPKRGVLMSFGRMPAASDCCKRAAQWCLQMHQNRFLPSTTDETEDEKTKRRKKKKNKKADPLSQLADFVESDLFLSKMASEKIASSGAQSGALAIFEEMKHGTEKKLIFHEGDGSYLLIYRKTRNEIEVIIKQLSGEPNPRIQLGVYVGNPVFVVSLLRDLPKVLDVISYSYFRIPTKVIWT